MLPTRINLGLGNGFSQIARRGLYVVDSTSGVTTTVLGVAGLVGRDVYLQSLRIPLPIVYPLLESNLQMISVVP